MFWDGIGNRRNRRLFAIQAQNAAFVGIHAEQKIYFVNYLRIAGYRQNIKKR
jgi:hypothetical protein